MAVKKEMLAEEPKAEWDDLVVAAVKKRYSIATVDNSLKTFEPGHQKMLRPDAEHWYSIANGTVIIGVPDTGDLSGVNAKSKLGKITSSLSGIHDELTAFEVKYNGMSAVEKEAFIKIGKFIEGALKLLGTL